MLNATYSPDDNKLRLYSVGRLDRETYDRVKAAGFRWAPKQALFVAPMWTPEREDLLIELCGSIDDEDTGLVDRAEERAERFEGYSENREKDAQRAQSAVREIADGIPLGQPILVGHHSERRARKDAERIENGMRKAVRLWDCSKYWASRAAGALRHAKYKERADVRGRRIKTIEADARKHERAHKEACGYKKVLETAKPELISRVLAELGPGLTYDERRQLREGALAEADALSKAVATLAKRADWHQRWISHCNHRIAYEKAMLQEQGIDVDTVPEYAPGGRVRCGQNWYTVLRVNRREGAIVSVTTNRRYGRLILTVEIAEYVPPTEEAAKAVAQATKRPPLCNYPGGVTMTKAEWAAIHRDYKGTRVVAATENAGAHRVRVRMGSPVFISDQKRVDPPGKDPAPTPAVPAPEVAPRPVIAPSRQPTQADAFERMKQSLAHGVQTRSAPDLFPTPPELAKRMVDAAELADHDRIGEFSAGTGRIVEAIRNAGKSCMIVAVESVRELAEGLVRRFPNEGQEIPQEVEVINADFMTPLALGTFDRIIINPPFSNGQDIAHIKRSLSMLRPAGRLVAICANGPRQQAQLGPIVQERGGTWEDLPAGTFAGTNVRAALLVIPA